MKSNFAGLTDTGLVRSVNQDAYYIDPDGRFFIVADGMGGHAGGQEASRLATHVIQSYLTQYWEAKFPSPVLLETAFMKANGAILKDQLEHPERADMGTTAVVVVFRGNQSYCANIGDSRLYRWRGSELTQITEDQTWVAQAVKRKALTPEQARSHPWRHVLSQCLGREDLRQIDIVPVEVESGDRLLLCSDGLTEELGDEEIGQSLAQIESCDGVASRLVEAAKEQGGQDNITVVVVELLD